MTWQKEGRRDGARQAAEIAPKATPSTQQRRDRTTCRPGPQGEADFARTINLRTARNLISQANAHLCVGSVEEGRAMVRLAGVFMDRAEQGECIVLPFPGGRQDG